MFRIRKSNVDFTFVSSVLHSTPPEPSSTESKIDDIQEIGKLKVIKLNNKYSTFYSPLAHSRSRWCFGQQVRYYSLISFLWPR